MPRYFFVLKNATDQALDEEGEVLPNDTAAHGAALETARELENWERFKDGTIVVTAEDGRIVTEVPLRRPLQ
jgi:hypothetical protein